MEGTRAGRCPYVGVGVVSWTGGIQVTTRCIEGREHTAPTRLHTRTWEALRMGLDGVLSAVLARPAERAARGFVAELLARYLIWCSDSGSKVAEAKRW
jgi:hypothetical protein